MCSFQGYISCHQQLKVSCCGGGGPHNPQARQLLSPGASYNHKDDSTDYIYKTESCIVWGAGGGGESGQLG